MAVVTTTSATGANTRWTSRRTPLLEAVCGVRVGALAEANSLALAGCP